MTSAYMGRSCFRNSSCTYTDASIASVEMDSVMGGVARSMKSEVWSHIDGPAIGW